jgi:hypothetical protein
MLKRRKEDYSAERRNLAELLGFSENLIRQERSSPGRSAKIIFQTIRRKTQDEE